MHQKESWEDFSEGITKLARSAFRRWMIGVETEDIRQELWVQFFQIRNKKKKIPKKSLLSKLKSFSSSFVRHLSEQKFSIRIARGEAHEESISEERERYWKYVRYVWDIFVRQLSPRDAEIMRLAAQGCSNEKISQILGIGVSTVRNVRSELVKIFKEAVDNNFKNR